MPDGTIATEVCWLETYAQGVHNGVAAAAVPHDSAA
jgi:hypothetical protein